MDIDFKKCGGLVPAIVQDADTKSVLMLGYMNEEALQKTIETKRVTFWSRSRQTLWTKGETSGNFLHLVSIASDCDNDTLLVKAHPDGPTCHTGTDTCWGETNERSHSLSFVPARLHQSPPRGDAPKGRTPRVCSERASTRWRKRWAKRPWKPSSKPPTAPTTAHLRGSDMLYHLLVMLTAKGLRIEDLARELQVRHDPNWDKRRREAKAKDV